MDEAQGNRFNFIPPTAAPIHALIWLPSSGACSNLSALTICCGPETLSSRFLVDAGMKRDGVIELGSQYLRTGALSVAGSASRAGKAATFHLDG